VASWVPSKYAWLLIISLFVGSHLVGFAFGSSPGRRWICYVTGLGVLSTSCVFAWILLIISKMKTCSSIIFFGFCFSFSAIFALASVLCFLLFFFDAAGSFLGFHSYPNLARGTGWCAPLYVRFSWLRRPAWFYVKGAVEVEDWFYFLVVDRGCVVLLGSTSRLLLKLLGFDWCVPFAAHLGFWRWLAISPARNYENLMLELLCTRKPNDMRQKPIPARWNGLELSAAWMDVLWWTLRAVVGASPSFTISIKNFSNNHIDSMVSIEGMESFHFTGFYGFPDLNSHEQSWDLLRRVDSEKIGGRRKPRIAMKEFEKVLDEMALVVRQSCSNHEAIFLNLRDRKPNDDVRAPRLFFKFEACWAKDRDSKQLIKRIWDENHNPCNLIDRLDKIHSSLGLWQHTRYNRLRSHMRSLIKWIDSLIDEPYMRSNLELLKSNRLELGRLYAEEESY
ncbi:hypothetical protein Golob_022880, partial [Gossypium lobatum]|nr:hypothetical protein [Gossypium lobatum]